MSIPRQNLGRYMRKRQPALGIVGQFILNIALVLTFGVSPVAAQMFPENDYAALNKRITKSAKDTSEIRSWFERSLQPLADTDAMFTKECLEFVKDVGDCTWGYDGSISADDLRKKWGRRFDLRNLWDHAFENGNCGWATRKVAGFQYLGELNGGDWFRLTIKGGCGDNDYSETITRVVKVVSSNGQCQIANLVAL
jgi:hypothetical protein